MSAADLTGGRTPGLGNEVTITPVDRARRHISTRFLRSELRLIF